MSRSGHFTELHEDVTVSLQAFRDGMSRLGAAVNIVTSNGPMGRFGFTATAVCSISDTPPSLLVCMNRGSLLNQPFRQNGVFCVNTLSAGQQGLSGVFSGVRKLEMEDRFRHGSWVVLETGSPVLRDAIVSFDCRIVQALEVNTHTIMIAEVLAIKNNARVTSLIYLNRQYHELHEEP